MKPFLLFAALLFAFGGLRGQVDSSSASAAQQPEVYTFVEEMPMFQGGQSALGQFLRDNIKYPASAIRDTIEGKVLVQFVVKNDGTLEAVRVLKGVRDDIDNEALRVVRMMPKWMPGKQNGKAVNVRFTLPVIFRLQ
jgi:protein TonB